MARLSSGNRINSASDDAAGVAIASRLTADIRGTDQAIRNALDGQALLDTAEGAHKEIENILQRMREVSVQAGNDTNNQQDRDNLQAELNALSAEIDRIAGTTTWAGTGLLNGDGTGGPGTATDFTFQVGANTSEADRISVQIGAMSTEALGFGSTAAIAAVPQIGGDVQPVTIASGTNSTASGSVFSLDSNNVTSGGEAQAVTIAAGNQTTAAGSVITLDAGTTTISTDTVTHVATTTAVTGATATDPETTVTTTTTKVHTGTGGTAEDPIIAGGNQTTTTGNVISIDTVIPSGFAINGVSVDDMSGSSVSGTGDVNGDGLKDLIVGNAGGWNPFGSRNSSATVVFGKTDDTAVEISTIATETTDDGFVINNVSAGDLTGFSVSGAGDVNGDGLEDLIIGAPATKVGVKFNGASYVVFGKANGTAIDLAAIASNSDSGGFVIKGAPSTIGGGDLSGMSVSGAGDVNGDGLADLIIGAPNDDPHGSTSGASFVVFGKTDGGAAELSSLQSSSDNGGFVINGVTAGDNSGWSVSGAGDVNNDGYADVIVGAIYDDPNGTSSGASHVVFGKPDGTAVELSAIEDNSNAGGFVINGVSTEDYSGRVVSGAGDVNGDGYADLIIGAYYDDPNGSKSGASHVVFGKSDGTAIELSDVEANSNTGGFVINGVSTDDESGYSVSGAGDVNGDGYADVIVGAVNDGPNGTNSGSSTVVFGKTDGIAVELSAINDTSNAGGFVINGASANDYSGISVSGAGDVNGDGYADVVVGTQYADPNGSMSGASHVVFGKADGKVVELSDVAASSGTKAALANNASFVVNGKTLTVDLSAHHDGINNDYYEAAATIASAINNDSDLQTAGYHATVATVDQVNAGTHAAGDVIITRAHIPDETVTTATASTTTTAGAALIMTPTKLGDEFQVNTYTSGAQADPAITNLSNGGFVVTWTNESNQDGSGYGVFGQMYDASGNSVGAEFQVNTYTSNNQRHPDISGLSDGGFVVNWHSRHQDGDDQGIFGQKFDASGNKAGSEFQVNTHTTSFQQYSAVTSLNDGGFVVTWHDDSGHDGNGYGVFGQKYTSSGSASGSQFQINSTTVSTQAYPSITSLTDGGFVVTWTDYSGEDGSDQGVFAQRYDASGNTVASEFQINTQTSGDQSWSDIKSLPNGGFVVTWTGQDASGNGIFAQRYSASGEKDGSEFQVNTYQNGNEMHAEVTALTDGGYVVIWYSDTHTDDTYYGVHGQRFDASGAAVGSQFLANTDISNAQQYPEIAPLADSGFVVTWQSYLQDGSHYGIYAQRFASGTPSGTVTTTEHTVSTVTGSTTGEAPFGSDVSFGVGGKTLTVDLSAHHDGSSNDYYGAAEAIATAINGDSDLQALGYSAAAATLAEVNAGTYAAGDIIITRADTPTTTTNTLVGNAASFVVEGITVNTDLSAYSEDLSGAAAAVASDIHADAALQALDYSATADTSNPGDIVITRANTPITQAYVAAAPATTAMSLASGGSARAAVAKIDTAITTVNIQRSELGAVSNRLNHTVNNLTNISANLSAARGGIEDADFALETTQLAKLQILNQAATAMLAQANASKQNILSLLQQ